MENIYIDSTMPESIANDRLPPINDHFAITEAILQCTNLSHLQRFLEEINRFYNFDIYNFCVAIKTRNQPVFFQLSDSNKEFVRYYRENRFFLIDPCIRISRESFRISIWNINNYKKDVDHLIQPHEKPVIENAIDFGIGQTVNIPVQNHKGDFGLFRFNASKQLMLSATETRCVINEIYLLLHLIFQKAIEIARCHYLRKINGDTDLSNLYSRANASHFPTVTLSQREKEVLMLVAEGKFPTEIASILRISENTVRRHLQNSRDKLGARNTTHAVAMLLMDQTVFTM